MPAFLRSLRWHTYQGQWHPPDTFYFVESERDAESIVTQGLAHNETPPTRLERPRPQTETPQATAMDGFVVPTPIQPDVNHVVAHIADGVVQLPDVMSTASTGGVLTPDEQVTTPRKRGRPRKDAAAEPTHE